MSDPVEVMGSGFIDGEEVTVTLEIDGTLIRLVGTATANESGAFIITADEFGGDASTKSAAIGARTVLAEGSEGSKASVPVIITEATPPTTPPSASLFVEPTKPTGTSAVWGAGFRAGELVTITALTSSSGGPILGAIEANENGSLSTIITVDLDPGIYTLKAVGAAGSEATAPLVISENK